MRYLSLLLVSGLWVLDVSATSLATSRPFQIDVFAPNVRSVDDVVSLPYCASQVDGARASVHVLNEVDDYVMSSSHDDMFVWQPNRMGTNTVVYRIDGVGAWVADYDVRRLTFPTIKPPLALSPIDSRIMIDPASKSFVASGGTYSIKTSGEGLWHASVSDTWIKLWRNDGNASTPVSYDVDESTNVEERVGYVYVSGHVHKVIQKGVGATIEPSQWSFNGERDAVAVDVFAEPGMSWSACPDDAWINVQPTHGNGNGRVVVSVAPFDEVFERQGSVKIAGQRFSVRQRGRDLDLKTHLATCDYRVRRVSVVVTAFDNTVWGAISNDPWITVDSSRHEGGGIVELEIEENDDYSRRKGTVTIGSEEFVVLQGGYPDVFLTVDKKSAEVSAAGKMDSFEIAATKGLPWQATSGAGWLHIKQGCEYGVGGQTFVYSVSPNSTVYERSAMISILPDIDSGLPVQGFVVIQKGSESEVSRIDEFPASGAVRMVDVTVDDIVEWTAETDCDWVEILEMTGKGSGCVSLRALPNTSAFQRTGVVVIAGHEVQVCQKAKGIEVSIEKTVFSKDGGTGMVEVHADGTIEWSAVSLDATWIDIKPSTASGTGEGIVVFNVLSFEGDGSMRTGRIKIGNEIVSVTQRSFDLSLELSYMELTSKGGSGRIDVITEKSSGWDAVTTVSWLKIVNVNHGGSSDPYVIFECEPNKTGAPRIGRIVVAGEMCDVYQTEIDSVKVAAASSRGGSIDGVGTYVTGAKVNLIAVPDGGYHFDRWITPCGISESQVELTVFDDIVVEAAFAPDEPSCLEAASGMDGACITWKSLPWALKYRIYRSETSEMPASAFVELDADVRCKYLDTTGIEGRLYWYWVEAIGDAETTSCQTPVCAKREKRIVVSPISYANLKGAMHSNPATYIEGDPLAFAPPGDVLGYTFAGWTPRGITADTTGPVSATAKWTANSYSVTYNANGGVGSTKVCSATYDNAFKLIENPFSRKGYSFVGWGMKPTSVETFGEMEEVSNLSAEQGGVVSLFAIWRPNQYRVRFNANGGSGTMNDQDLVYGSSALLNVNQFSVTGMAFAGWSLEKDGVVAFGDGEVVLNLTDIDDAVVDLYAVWQKIEVAAPQIITSTGLLWFVDQTEVTISCVTEGALIYYSTTGTTPRTTDSFLYTGPFVITDTTTIKAVAVKNGVKSAYVTVTIAKKSMSLAEAVGCEGLMFTTGGDAPWTPVEELSDGGDGYSARSGLMACPASEAVSWMEVALDGPGELSFWWKVSCENDPIACDWDRLMCFVDDATEDSDRIDGFTDWEQKKIEFTGLGVHKVRWVYHKDDTDDEMIGEDCGWVDGVVWRPGVVVPSEVTGGAEFRVTSEWAAQYAQFQARFGSDLVTAMAKPTGKVSVNGALMQVWHDYVAGTDPTNPNDLFKAVLEMVDGRPVIRWHPDLNKSAETRTYKVYGRRSLSNTDVWEYPANSAEHQFFKVDVSMPCVGDGGSDSPGVIEAWQFVALPTAVSGLVYDGTVKQGVLPGTGYTLSGASATSAGNYTAVATLASGFKWESGLQVNQQIPWSIAKANNAWVSAPTMSATTFLAGSAVTVTDGVSKFGTATRNYSNSAIQSLSAGSYTLVSTVSGTANYTGLTHSIPFTVTAPATKIALPSAKTGLVYTGSTQTGVAAGTGYTLSGNTGVNAGTYTATATLKSGYAWSDGVSSQSRTISWSIAKATNSWLTQPSLSSTEFAEGASVTINMGAVKFGIRQANYTAADLAGLSAGSYTLEVSVVETDDYTGLTKSIPFTVTESTSVSDRLYCVIDLSAGPTATAYPVSYLSGIPGGEWSDEYKTTKLVLRKIEPGEFTMGRSGSTSGLVSGNETLHQVTLTKGFWIGVFEVTQKQWELVMGTRPSKFSNDAYYASRPVEMVSYDMIRGNNLGAQWPITHQVDDESFLGEIRVKTDLEFDLPTDAQWEYACRAGTTTMFNNGMDTVKITGETCLLRYARYAQNYGGVSTIDNSLKDTGKGTAKVGTYLPNAWGIYDMHGNVLEWTLDWYADYTSSATEDPVGPLSGTMHASRGGDYYSEAYLCCSSYRKTFTPSSAYNSLGFRVCFNCN